MRLTTWNVNGIRNPFGYQPWSTTRTFPAMFDILDSDIVVMQELKIQRKDLTDDMVLLDGWDCYFSLPKHKKGYSGVGIYTRNATCSPIRAEEGILGVLSPPNTTTSYRDLPEDQHIGGYPSELQIAELGVDPVLLDSEGRCVCLEFPAFVLFGVYSPANSNGLRDDFRYGFLCALDCRIRNLAKMGKRVVLVGDLNVSRSELDTAGGLEDMKKAGITHDEYISTPNRRVFNQLLIGGEVVGERDEGREEALLWDLSREFHPDRQGMFTHWEQKINARPGNFGSRIDFVLVNKDMKDWFVDSNIQEGLMGSDHCPVYGEFKDKIELGHVGNEIQEIHLLDIMSPSGTFIDGQRRKPWSVKDIPAFSGKLLPEFDKRRSIKDMFKKPSLNHSTSSQSTGTPQDSIANAPEIGKKASNPSTFQPADTHINGTSGTAQSPQKSATTTQPSPDLKRKLSETSPAKLTKKTKSSTTTPSNKKEPAKGQQSLKGFFAPKSKPPVKQTPLDTNDTDDLPAHLRHDMDRHNLDASKSDDTNSIEAAAERIQNLTQEQSPAPETPPSPSATSTDGFVHDPIATKESWTKLLRKPAAPQCEHGEPCKTMLTKKKGENQGRSFWMCQRPLGPSGAKEKKTQWRCSTFIWSSDFKADG